MKKIKKALKFSVVFGLVISLLLTGCSSQSKSEPSAASAGKTKYPEKPITMIVPWAAGGGTDLIFRKLADLMSKDLGQPVVIQNVNGAGGQVGFKQIANAKPDGYTVGATTISMLLQKATQPDGLGVNNFTNIAMINQDPATLTVKADSPYKDVASFVEAAKKEPGKLRISNSGAKGVWHVASMLYEKQAGIKVIHLPYDGANPAAIAVGGGHAEATTASPPEVKPLVDSGKLKVLAVMDNKRHPLYPNVPTLKESGYDLSFGVWRSLVGPKGIPADITSKLEASVKKAVESEDFKKFMSDSGYGITYMNSADLTKLMTNQEKELAELLK
ncbi:MAG: tripartite tricarboxylate transporter substrate binding protein [Desulfitobacterium hafniense]|nr:tripartite tricarboxylate transporter substrate binding protein [Desulfitobacterium hafniense]